MGKLESAAYAFLSIPPMYVFVNEVLLLNGKLGMALAIFTLVATYALLFVSIEEVTKYIASRIGDEIKAAHAAGFLNIFPFALAFMRAVQRTTEFSIYTRLFVVRTVSMIVPLIVTYFRATHQSRPRRASRVSSRRSFQVSVSPHPS